MKNQKNSPSGEGVNARSEDNPKHFEPRRLEQTDFPDTPQGNYGSPATIANIAYLLEEHAITARYNVIKKKLEIDIPHLKATSENSAESAMTHIYSLAKLNGITTGQLAEYVAAIGDANAYNPVKDWIESKPWDGEDRLPPFYGTIAAEEHFPKELQIVLMRKWLLSCTAAALKPSGFRCRGVLTLQGKQGIGKTSWGKRLISDEQLRDSVIKTDLHLDSSNKDSSIVAISHWIVEIGELDSSFRKDIARLKGFLTSDSDKVRRPYGRVESEYPRRTVFFATVNQSDFLVDSTGNSRWWTIPVLDIHHEHAIDMQQLFAQMAVDFRDGEEWWLTHEEEAALAEQNQRHMNMSLVLDKLSAVVNFDAANDAEMTAFTASELLEHAELKNPTNAQAKECGSILREHFGKPKRINGRDKWYVSLQPDEWEGGEAQPPEDPDIYD